MDLILMCLLHLCVHNTSTVFESRGRFPMKTTKSLGFRVRSYLRYLPRPYECNRDKQIWPHTRSVPFPVLSHAGSAPFVKEQLPTAWNIQNSLFSGLWPLRVHSYRDKSCRTKNNICLVGALQEHCDLTMWTAARMKDPDTKKFAIINHTPHSSCL